ncbi:WbqC family protein [Aureispira anguillae]|uniref:WbqC family protein n=1 Tax=Aureispira anguillae TaxID=2864201 RepID=A0A915YLF0_9BACT|nr:WbqC family protein [Aureispira anguillae]BDS15082.1 WbqC family protein [Aureispira anguillae]
MNTSILLEIQYLGPIQYYSKFVKYPNLYIEQHENYRKGSFRNRCCIATANGVVPLSIPLLKGKHQQANIRTVAIDNSKNWQTIHWRSIKTAYGNSPFFEYYQDDFSLIYQKKYDLLFDFCLDLQELVLNSLQIAPSIQYTTAFNKATDETVTDFRNCILPKNYTAPKDSDFKIIPYPQVFEDRLGFVANLSILDLLFCTGPEAIYYLQMNIQ